MLTTVTYAKKSSGYMKTGQINIFLLYESVYSVSVSI